MGLGTNQGDRLANLREARRRLAAEPGVRLEPAWYVLETPALLAEGDRDPQPPYLNSVAELRCALGPQALLGRLLAIERGMGRRRTTRWGPRVIDLDLLLYGDRQVAEPGLTLPHPGLFARRFVLWPLAALAGDLVPPGHSRSVRAALSVLGP